MAVVDEQHFLMTAVVGEQHFLTTAVVGKQHFLTTAVIRERLPEIPDGGMPEQERKRSKSRREIASAMALASVGIHEATRWKSNLARSQKIFRRNFMARGKRAQLLLSQATTA
jgi:hypothetical protein